MIASVQRRQDITGKGSKKSQELFQNPPKTTLGIPKIEPGGLQDAIFKRFFV